ncbi:MAG TPA: hypothetical protein VF796_27930, partial [Humisphaera sp.]
MDAPVTPTPAAPTAAAPTAAAPQGRRRLPPLRYLLPAVLAVVAAGAIGWWAAGRKVWTDGRQGTDAIRVASSAESPRQVLWAPPRAVEGAFNSAAQEYEPALSPDGAELYFVRGQAGNVPAEEVGSAKPQSGGGDIYVSVRRDNAWTEPVPVAAINTPYDELGPRLTPDGRVLLFYSNRPGGLGGYDLWASGRLPDGRGWAPAVNLGPSVNSEFDEYSPAPSPDGKRLYFSTNRVAAAKEQRQAWRATIRAAGTGDFDLWVADAAAATADVTLPAAPPATQPTTAPTTAPTTVPASVPVPSVACTNPREVSGVNTPYHEGASCLSPAGDFLYFASNRPGGQGKFDLYRVRLTAAGEPAGDVENLGPTVNTADNETDPQLAMGGFRLLFSSDRKPAPPAAATAQAAPAASAADLSAPPATPPAGSADADWGYDLYQTDSREVYPDRARPTMPSVAWSTWVALAALVACVPLLLLVVRMDRRRLSLLQKCLLVALLLHAAMLVSFREVVVNVVPGITRSLGLGDITIHFDSTDDEPPAAPAGTARGAGPRDLAGPVAAAGEIGRQDDGPNQLLDAKPDVQANVPQAQAGRD